MHDHPPSDPSPPDSPVPLPAGGSDTFFEQVYAELRLVARARMRGERAGQTFQTTELVHEAYLKLRGGAEDRWQNRRHFFSAAAEAMRRILIDRARARQRIKRGADSAGTPPRRLALELKEVAELADDRDPETILALDRAIEVLAEVDPRLRETVKLRFYAGLSVEEVAEALGVSSRTVKRDWTFARVWLFDRLRADAGTEP